MRTLYPRQVVTENGRAGKTELAVKRTDAGNRAANDAHKFSVRTAERLRVIIDSAGCKGRQYGIVWATTGTTVAWAIEDGLDTVAAEAQLVHDVGCQG